MNFEYEIVGINNGILDLQDVKQKWFNLYSSRKFGKISFLDIALPVTRLKVVALMVTLQYLI